MKKNATDWIWMIADVERPLQCDSLHLTNIWAGCRKVLKPAAILIKCIE